MDYSRKSTTIKEMYRLYKEGILLLQPFFQRNLVWTEKAKSRFIESILLELPIAEIYLYEEKNGIISVIDGQQRLSTIFNFIDKKFILVELEKVIDALDSDIDFKYKDNFLDFEIHYVLIESTAKKDEIIDMYSRINEYTVNLNEQELRKAAYSSSEFLMLSEELSLLEFFEYGRFFTKRKRQRMSDVEFISELLALMIGGIQDKKLKLDDFYKNNTHLKEYAAIDKRFKEIIEYIESIFSFGQYFRDEKRKYEGHNAAKNFGSTRFRQQADFYSLFAIVKELIEEKITYTDLEKENILKILLVLDYLIEPESDIELLSTYAVKCVSQGNTRNSRVFRYKLLKEVFDYVSTGVKNKLIETLILDFTEIFEIDIDFLNFDLDEVKKDIDLFYSGIEA